MHTKPFLPSNILLLVFASIAIACSDDVSDLEARDGGPPPRDAGPRDGGTVCDTSELACGASCCRYGELCRTGECVQDVRGPYCRACTPPSGANPNPCDDPTSRCLDTPPNSYCGVDCALGQVCPHGYECRDISIATGGGPCAGNQDCPMDACDPATNTCTLTGRPCATGAAPCGPIACVEGACLVGRNCIPVEGLSCANLLR